MDKKSISEIFKRLEKISINFNKTPNRVYTIDHLIKKEEEVTRLIAECKKPTTVLETLVGATEREVCRNKAIKLIEYIAEKKKLGVLTKEAVGSVSDSEQSESENSNLTINSKLVEIVNLTNDSEQSEREKLDLTINCELDIQNITMALSFKDCEDSFEVFDGVSNEVQSWVESFEQQAQTFQLTELQKFVFCKKLLRDAAKSAVASSELNTFAKVKEQLILDFKREVKSVDVHRELTKSKKERSETFFNYAFRMRALGNRGKLDDLSIIDYIINGLDVSESDKNRLFEARSFNDLKTKLEVFDRSKPVNTTRASGYRSPPVSGSSGGIRAGSNANDGAGGNNLWRNPAAAVRVKREYETIKCFNCGENGHLARACPSQTKCFRCNGSGHRSSECRNTSA